MVEYISHLSAILLRNEGSKHRSSRATISIAIPTFPWLVGFMFLHLVDHHWWFRSLCSSFRKFQRSRFLVVSVEMLNVFRKLSVCWPFRIVLLDFWSFSSFGITRSYFFPIFNVFCYFVFKMIRRTKIVREFSSTSNLWHKIARLIEVTSLSSLPSFAALTEVPIEPWLQEVRDFPEEKLPRPKGWKKLLYLLWAWFNALSRQSLLLLFAHLSLKSFVCCILGHFLIY